jgi:hypothetical protein
MFRKLPFFVAMLFVFAAYGQTIVSTSPENKNVVLEEFTGIYCVYCPDGHAIAQAIKDANPDRVSLINIHTGGFANPSGNHPDFRTDYGAPIAAQTGLTGYPSGTVNRHVFPGRSMTNGRTAMGRNFWTVSANDILDMESYVNIGAEATIDIQTGELIVHVEVYYTGNSPESTNKLNVALLQDNTKGPQTGGGQGNNYNHMHRLVDLLTGQWGEDITTTTAGSFVDRTYTFTIPEDYRDVPTVLEDMKIVAFISETTQEIPTGTTARPFFTGLELDNDAEITAIHTIEPVCENTIAPVINVKNQGQNSLTNLEITYEINGESFTHNWTGNIPALWDEDIQLPETTFSLEPTNNITVSVPNDENNTNNTQSATFDEAVTGTGTVKLEVRTDQYGNETRWTLADSEGNVIESGGPYNGYQTYNYRFDLEEDCYVFTAIDTYGDGGARFTLKDSNDTQLFYISGNWGAEKSGNFGSDGILSTNDFNIDNITLYPNPAEDVLYISNAEEADIQVFDILGKSILVKNRISMNEGIQVDHFPAGAYFLKISKNGNTTTKKFLIAR